MEIICDLSQSPSSWSSSLIYNEREIELTSLGQEFDTDKNLWTLEAILPVDIISELYDLKLDIPGENTDISNN